jgi:hypothetical protein
LRTLLISLLTVLAGCSKSPGASTRPAQAALDSCDRVAADWRPPLPSQWSEQIDSSDTVVKPSEPAIRYIRNRFDVWFADSLSGPEACRVLKRHKATVVGSAKDASGAGIYTIAVPDPGTNWNAWETLLERLRAEPGFRHVYGISYGGQLRIEPEG